MWQTSSPQIDDRQRATLNGRGIPTARGGEWSAVQLRRMHDTGDYSISDLAEVFSVSRPTVYRTLGRQRPAA
jgi:hypothetical protein